MLGNAQTLLGVLITLIVLCLFNEKGNFLWMLFKHISSDLSEQIRQRTLKIKKSVSEDLSSDDPLYNVNYWKNNVPLETNAKIDQLYDDLSFVNFIFLNEASKLSDLPRMMQKYMHRSEMGYIELHLLLLSVFVMVCDLFLPVSPLLNIFLLGMTVLSLLYTVNLWALYWKETMLKTDSARVFDLNLMQRLKRIVPITAFNGIVGLLSFGVYFIPMQSAFQLALQMVIILGCIWFHTHKEWKSMEQTRYNNRFVVKHTAFVVIYPAVLTFCVYGLMNIDSPDVDIWRLNVLSAFSITRAGALYTTYVAVCSMFAPVLVEYCLTRMHAKRILNKLSTLGDSYNEQVEKLSQEYKQLIEGHIQGHSKK